MNGLAGARVVIVDDEKDQALPIIKELSKKGIPAVYFGNVNDLPSDNHGLQGVRLAILDMDLVGGGVSEKTKISALLGYMKKIFSTDNGPYGIIIWTQHVELQKPFEDEVFSSLDIPNPVFTVCISKNNCQDKKGNFKLSRVSSEINKALKKFSPLLILQKWEETCFLSATQVTNELASLAVQDSTDFDSWQRLWNEQFLKLMHTMALAEAGKQLNSTSCLNAFYGSMNPLHADRMESNIPKLRKSLSTHAVEIMNAEPVVDVKVKAKLNTKLHLAINGNGGYYAGNIYTQAELQTRIPSVKMLLGDFVNCNDNQKTQAIKKLAPLTKSIVIEMNAICDHVQNNIRIGRFIAGLIVPQTEIKKLKRADFIYQLGPIFLEFKGISAGVYYFCLSARHLLTIELKQVTKAKKLGRLRGQAFGDLQDWFAYRAARPGKLILSD